MTEITDTTVETPETTSRFNARKIAKVALITTAVLGAALVAKRKLSGSVDGGLTVNVETNES